LNEELTNVALGPLNFISCFWFDLSIGRRDRIDPGCLVLGSLVGSIGQWEVEEAFVETIEIFGFSFQVLQLWGRFLGLGASAGAGTVAGSDDVVAGGLGAALADVQMAVAVAAGGD
jgi:hypothetical protein